ncbi:hypothetical protein [Actinoplanes missouriensis]|uniref:hypothetical protein n=1 Tax=Actinoplanes missouriensis TaxID=1866 RepID=UPI0012F871AF|nr:hypothetical protein [Actinoplanes missouriensis]
MFSDGSISEIGRDGGAWTYPSVPGLFGDLIRAGYPLFGDPRDDPYWGYIDLRVDDDQVIVHTDEAPPHEHDMGAAGELFLAWFRQNAEDRP